MCRPSRSPASPVSLPCLPAPSPCPVSLPLLASHPPAACSWPGPLQRRHRLGVRHRDCVLHRILPRPHHGLAGPHIQGVCSGAGVYVCVCVCVCVCVAAVECVCVCGAPKVQQASLLTRPLPAAAPAPCVIILSCCLPPCCSGCLSYDLCVLHVPHVPLQDQYKTPFQPVMPGSVMVPYM